MRLLFHVFVSCHWDWEVANESRKDSNLVPLCMQLTNQNLKLPLTFTWNSTGSPSDI